MQTQPRDAVPTLDEQRRDFGRRRFLAMPLAGAIAWTIIGIAGALLAPLPAVWVVFIGTGFIFYLGMFLSRFTGENFLSKSKPKNTFDTLFLLTVAMALMVYSIAIPFFQTDYTSLSLTVGIFHSVARTVLVVAAWYLVPHDRFVVIPAVIVAVYAATIYIPERRWRSITFSRPVPASA